MANRAKRECGDSCSAPNSMSVLCGAETAARQGVGNTLLIMEINENVG